MLRSGSPFLLVAVLLIYALNPFYWIAFDAGPRGLFDEALRFGSDLWAGEVPRWGLRERYPGLAGLSHPLEFPLSFYRWRTQPHAQASPREWARRRFVMIHESLFSRHATFTLQWLVVPPPWHPPWPRASASVA